MRKFINGPLEGTNLEIMPSKAATELPNGAVIREAGDITFTATQQAHIDGDINVHDAQTFTINTRKHGPITYTGPSIAQEWKILHRGERPFYMTGENNE